MEKTTTATVETEAATAAATTLAPPLMSNIHLAAAAAQWNLTSHNLEDLPFDSNFAWLLCALAMAMAWIIYITYYNSRVVGYVITKVINMWFMKQGFLKIGSFSISVLSGKIMFRDVAYIDEDLSIRVQDGWLRFRWWMRYVKKSSSEDVPPLDARVSLLLNGFEFHIYNRSYIYAHLEKILGLDPHILPPDSKAYQDEKDAQDDSSSSSSSRHSIDRRNNALMRDLVPVIKVEVSCGRVVFGNRLLPTTMLINVEEAHLMYSTRPSSNRVDLFAHVVKCRAENFKIILAPSPRYLGMEDEPPRFMGEGFVVFQSNVVDLYHYRDEPGLVPEEPEVVELVNGEIITERTSPVWELEIKCGKGTDFSYGPWADRQRDHLFKFFFPQDYQPLKVTKIAQPGERRQFLSFDVRLSTLSDATIDTLFSKDKETMAVHMNVKPGSYLELTLPWIISKEGYTTRFNGQLLHLDASTSLQYRSLAECETLEFDVRVKYPLTWNEHQLYTCTFTGCKATASIIYAHKEFFQDLICDWASKSKPDLMHFVPYTCQLNLLLKEFEVVVVTNEHNWVDCSSQHHENCQLAVCGELFDMSLNLPFIDFLPPTVPIKIWMQGESVDLAMFLPETNSSRNVILAMSNNCKVTKRDGSLLVDSGDEKKWRNKADKSAAWVDCMSVPIVALSLTYTYHPIPPIVTTETDFNITTPEKEELLLNPIRPPTGDGSSCVPKIQLRPQAFDPTVMPADVINLELEVGPSVLFLYGSLLRCILLLKDNYIGADQHFWDFDVTPKSTVHPGEIYDDNVSDFDPRLYRPLEVTVSVTMHDIQAHLVKNCNENDPSCPAVYLERLGFELHKKYDETKLQLLLSPLVLSVTDVVQRCSDQQHLKDGHVAVSGLQVRAHAMFSDENLPLDDETIEYAWLVEVQCGHLTGRLTTPQVHDVVMAVETFVMLAEDAENSLQSPSPFKLCHHGVGQLTCADTKPDFFCPTSEDIKYRMTRLSVESMNFFLVESGTALSLQVRPIRFSTCNLHGHRTSSGLTALFHQFHFRQFIMTGQTISSNTTGLLPGTVQNACLQQDMWLEVGAAKFGPLYVDSLRMRSHRDIHAVQDAFLHFYDARSRRLWFLWPQDKSSTSSSAAADVVSSSSKCGCLGSCSFFGNDHGGVNFFDMNDCSKQQQQQHSRTSSDSGYGQSLLHEGKMVFDVFVPTGSGGGPTTPLQTLSPIFEKQRFSFNRGYANRCTPISSRDVSVNSLTTDQESVQQSGGGSNVMEVVAERTGQSQQHPESELQSRSPLPPRGFATTTPPFQRAFSHPESRTLGHSPTRRNPASPTLPFGNASFHEKTRRKISVDAISVEDPGDERFAVASSMASLQVGGTPLDSLPGSPTNGGDKSLRTSSRQSVHSGRRGGVGRTLSVRSVRRATSIGGESVQSLDVFYAAEDDLNHAAKDGHVLQNGGVGSSQSLLQTVIEIPRASTSDDKESNSVSSTSFISALSSQEDLALVDLHTQLNKPITESPLLMYAYNSHMTKLMCSNWYSPPPLPHNTPQSAELPRLHANWGLQWVPQFVPLSEGFTSVKIVEKDGGAPIPRCGRQPAPSQHSRFRAADDFHPGGGNIDDELLYSDGSTSKHTMVIRFKGDIDVYISPLVLEALQQFIESVASTLSSLHPLTVVNHLHCRCTSSVQSANQLKKEKYMYVSHLREFRRSLDSCSAPPSQQTTPGGGSVYEETHTSQLQAFVNISRVNVSILQSSIVEEVTSFSALDNLRDVTCVSLLLVSLANVSGKVFTSVQSRKSIQTLQVGNPGAAQRRKGGKESSSSRPKKSKTDWFPPEPITIETSETQQEESVVAFDLRRIHSQLRRLKNSSSVLKDAVLTIVPKQRSKVFFTFEKLAHLHDQFPLVQPIVDHDQGDVFGIHDPTTELEERMGFIMFECGMEGFAIKAVKRLGFDGQSHSNLAEAPGVDLQPPPTAAPEDSATTPKLSSSKPSSSSGGGIAQADPPESLGKTRSATESSEENVKSPSKSEDLGDSSSCVIDFASVWFNFAAPPHMPNKQRIDFTRLDWHLLSTATPAINSWLNPGNRLLVSTHKVQQESHRRQLAVIACLMAEALDAQGLHLPIRAKYNMLMPLAKTLREDPSCQLLTVLQRYVTKCYGCALPMSQLEETLSGELVPKVEVLHKGLVALGRQWKNVLYMPSLLERSMKMQKNTRPFNVTFAVPLMGNGAAGAATTTEEEAEEGSAEECDVSDEKTMLLKPGGLLYGGQMEKEGGGVLASTTSSTSSGVGSRPELLLVEGDFNGSGASSHPPKKRLPSYHPRLSRASLAFPVLVTGSLESYGRHSGLATPMFTTTQSTLNRQIFLDQKQRQQHHHQQHLGSNASLRSGSVSVNSVDMALLSTPKQQQRLPPPPIPAKDDEDLYNWMARQLDYQKSSATVVPIYEQPMRKGDSRGDTMASDETKTSTSGDVDFQQQPAAAAFSLAPLAAQLADAHVIFQPLLTSLGVPSQIAGTTLGQRFGPNLTVRATLDLFKIDIVESELSVQGGGSLKGRGAKFHAGAASLETPAFQCEKLSVEVDLREMQDVARAKTTTDSGTPVTPAPPAFSAAAAQQTLIYASGGGFKRHSTVAVNFCINVNTLCQQVNLPLLRLLHQFLTMYHNARETQMELKESRSRYRNSGGGNNYRVHKKNDSSSGSETHTDGLKLPNSFAGSPVDGEQSSASSIVLKDQAAAAHGVGAGANVVLRRPQSLTQRLRASTKGYTNLLERTGSPLSVNLSETVVDIGDISCASDHSLLVDDLKEKMPRCWRTMFYLLDLYATMPETKMVANRSPVGPHALSYKGNGRYEPLKEHRIDMEDSAALSRHRTTSNDRLRTLHKSLVVRERIPLVVFGVLKVQCTRLLATLSGLKLEAELSNLQLSHTRKEKVVSSGRKWTETSVTGYLGRTMIVLLEGAVPNLQVIVKVTGGKSQVLYSGHSKRAKEKNSALVTVGPINVDIPQHPVALHGMMTRSTKQLSSTLQELRVPRGLSRHVRTSDEVDASSTRSPRPSVDMAVGAKQEQQQPSQQQQQQQQSSTAAARHHLQQQQQQQKLIQPIVVHFSIIVDSLTIGASLLPSLKAQYHMGQLTSVGVTGSKAKFTVDLPKHSLSFATKVQASDVNLPSSASVDLPLVHITAEYVQQQSGTADAVDLHFADGAVLRKGSYLSAVANLGAFEHSLTTDLLNHLVFVQKVFMKEINEVVQKMSGGDRPVRLWPEETGTPPAQVLYSIQLRLKGIQITATTPTSSAVRLETGALELQLSNRVQNLTGKKNSMAKLFLKAHVDVNLSLGQLHRNLLFDEAEPEFQQVAYFKTRINLRNALRDEMIMSSEEDDDKEAVLINLARPLIYIQPIAIDRAVLVWLNYKNAYEYWNEQRSSLNKEVLTATQQVLDKVQAPLSHQIGAAAHAPSTLFLQLTVHDMGICLPLNRPPATSVFGAATGGGRQVLCCLDGEPQAACVVTLESTRISACSSGSVVSKGRFSGLCVRFADDFETSLDDWKPDSSSGGVDGGSAASMMNLCVVSEGTYEFCSRTMIRQHAENAKWIVNVTWEMEGVAIHVDTNIGKHLSALAHTLTSLAGSQDSSSSEDHKEDRVDGSARRSVHGGGGGAAAAASNRKASVFAAETLPAFVFDPNLDAKKRSRLIEKEMNEQAKIVNDLKALGASQSTIEQETRRLHELEALVFNDFRRDVIKRLRRQSVKQQTSSFKGKSELAASATPAPTPEKSDVPVVASSSGSSRTPSSHASSPSHGHARTISLDSARVTFPSSNVVDLTLTDKWPSVDMVESYGAADFVSTPLTGESSPVTTTDNNTPSELAFDGLEAARSTPSLTTTTTTTDDEESSQRFAAAARRPKEPSGGGGSAPTTSKSLSEPNIDFELDVKVLINSGKCVLHTKDYREEELRAQKSLGRERSLSSSTFDLPMSPGHRKRAAAAAGASGPGPGASAGGTTTMRPNASNTKLKFLPSSQPAATDFTLFLVPGLDVKLHYNSHTDGGGGAESSTANVQQGRKPGMKKASLFAWLTLQSIPEETVITPHFLDFLEKALEPIPLPQTKVPVPPPEQSSSSVDASVSDFDGVGGGSTLTSSLMMAAPGGTYAASFPVDVIVYLRIQPSILRFSCLPISRVECLLRLPSLDLIISTKRAEEESSSSNGEFRESPPVLGAAETSFAAAGGTGGGGLSVTACLADFSVYIFHPYGGKKASGSSGSSKDLSSNSSLDTTTTTTSPLSGTSGSSSDRKDALSIQLEFVKVNMSRSRKVMVLESGGNNNCGQPPGSSGKVEQFGVAVIRFSTTCDIGSASFKYDMRRLTEILAFPKAWYRRTIMRRLFLGDQSTIVVGSDQEDDEDDSSSESSLSPPSKDKNDDDVFDFTTLNLGDDANTSGIFLEASAEDVSAPVPPVPPTHDVPDKRKLTLNLPPPPQHRLRAASAPSSPKALYQALSNDSLRQQQHLTVPSPPRVTTTTATKSSRGSWETLVLFAVNLSKLNVHMNMGNVMGNTVWTTRDLRSQGRFSIGSSGHKNMFVSLGLGGSSLDAKGGIVGGAIELSRVDTYLHVREDPGQEPDHGIGVKLFALESRLDYMGTSVLMGRVSSLSGTLRDEWRVNEADGDDNLPTKRPALIFIHGEMDWDQLQLIISKSTTADLIKMYSKLEEFFTQQFHSSKRVLSSLQPTQGQQQQQQQRSSVVLRKSSSCRSRTSPIGSTQTPTSVRKSARSSVSSDWERLRHHRHWQGILAKASGLKLPMLSSALPKHGTIFGGTMDLRGNNISLACFHGVNFRAKSWALFSLSEPNISFATEAQDVTGPETSSVDTHIVQNISFTLGHNITEHTRHIRMATVCRISRNTVFPPQFRTMHEWFHYSFAMSELDEVDRFPGLERERRDSITTTSERVPPRHSPKPQDCNHTMEVIFALPSLQLHLKTEHLQTERIPGPNDGKPLVECSFITEFEDHIFVTVDAEAFFFLHDLITAYIKEKDRVGTPASHSSKQEKESENAGRDSERKFKLSDPTESLPKDWRSYQCKTWHLEPTVRLLSWAGKQIEPYGVDYILQKLGFSHARVTIPKWVQRGAMDPLDKLLSVLAQKMVSAFCDPPRDD